MTNYVNVVNRGFEYLCQYMSGTSTTSGWTFPTIIGWGGANGYNTVATPVLPGAQPTSTQGTGQYSDVGSYQEFSEARVAGTASVPLSSSTTGTSGPLGTWNGTIVTQVLGTITASAGENVGESILAFNTTKPSAYTISGNQASTSATLLTVTTSGGTAGGYYQMNNEVIYVSGTAASNVWTIARGMNGSTPNTAKTGDVVTNGNPPGYGPSNPNHADIFAHAGFTQLALNSGDSIAFTWQINVTS